jgi:hypothetical protein
LVASSDPSSLRFDSLASAVSQPEIIRVHLLLSVAKPFGLLVARRPNGQLEELSAAFKLTRIDADKRQDKSLAD